MLSPIACPQGKDFMEPVFQLRNPPSIQIRNCESQKPLAGAVGARSRVWPWLHSASLALLSLPIIGVVACAPTRPSSDSESCPPSQRCSARGCGQLVSDPPRSSAFWGNGLCNDVNKSETNFGLLCCYWRGPGLQSPSCLPESTLVPPACSSCPGQPPGPQQKVSKLDKTQGFFHFWV